MGLVVLTTVLPGAQRGGGEVVSQSIVDALTAAGQCVRVVGYRRPADTSPMRPGELCAGRRPIETSAAGPRALAWMTRALATRSPYSCAKYDSRAYARAARSTTGDGAAAVIVDHAQVHFAIRRIEVAQPLVFVAHNAEARVYEALAAGARGPAARWVNARESRLMRSVEADLARRARQVWALTADDAAYFRDLVPDADVRALEVASPIAAPERGCEPDCDVALIGSWSWRANARGLDWFAREVVPRLSRELKIEVAGAGCDWLRGRHANVTVRGVVPDARTFMSRARVVAVPAVSGGGVQVKTLDAIATGVAVVSTPTGVRGLGALPESVAIASSAADFAAALAGPRDRGVRDAQRADALAWSAARRSRFEASVTSWIAELAADDRGGTAVECRSR